MTSIAVVLLVPAVRTAPSIPAVYRQGQACSRMYSETARCKERLRPMTGIPSIVSNLLKRRPGDMPCLSWYYMHQIPYSLTLDRLRTPLKSLKNCQLKLTVCLTKRPTLPLSMPCLKWLKRCNMSCRFPHSSTKRPTRQAQPNTGSGSCNTVTTV